MLACQILKDPAVQLAQLAQVNLQPAMRRAEVSTKGSSCITVGDTTGIWSQFG